LPSKERNLGGGGASESTPTARRGAHPFERCKNANAAEHEAPEGKEGRAASGWGSVEGEGKKAGVAESGKIQSVPTRKSWGEGDSADAGASAMRGETRLTVWARRIVKGKGRNVREVGKLLQRCPFERDCLKQRRESWHLSLASSGG